MLYNYKSKIGLEFILLIYVPIITLCYFVFTEFNLAGLLTICILFIFINYLIFTTQYTIHSNSKKLIIKSGFLVQKSIEIENIKEIKKSKSWISSPALSVDRIEIFYNKYDSILISPKNKEEFIQQLQQINPNIKTYI